MKKLVNVRVAVLAVLTLLFSTGLTVAVAPPASANYQLYTMGEHYNGGGRQESYSSWTLSNPPCDSEGWDREIRMYPAIGWSSVKLTGFGGCNAIRFSGDAGAYTIKCARTNTWVNIPNPWNDRVTRAVAYHSFMCF
jgi:hypothetical protein